MSNWTDAARVRQVLEDLWSGEKIDNEEWNSNLKKNALAVLRQEYGYAVSQADDSRVIVVIDDDPWPERQFNDDKVRDNWNGNEKYVLVIPHPRTEEQFVSWSKELAILHAIYENSDMTVKQGL